VGFKPHPIENLKVQNQNFMSKYISILFFATLLTACQTQLLDPPPVDSLTDEVVFKRASDLPGVRVGLYNAFRSIASPLVQAGDFTADNIIHIGTFTDYQELGGKQITPANGVVADLWNSIYSTIYLSNFILERIGSVSSIKEADSKLVIAEAKFLRGYAYFVAANTFGGVPKVTTTNLETNKNIARASKADILAFVLEDYKAAFKDLPNKPSNAAYASKDALRAALARYYLYQKDWSGAELYADSVIRSTNAYQLVQFDDVVLKDFTKESIFEVGYTLPDYNGDINNYFIGRREVIPSNQTIAAFQTRDAGRRDVTLGFDFAKQKGNDNGWSLLKYGTKDDANRNFSIFRLGEMYLIRAESRVQQNKLATAIADINVLRTRATLGFVATTFKPLAPTKITSANQTDLLLLIEKERIYELAYEGHRWYDLVRTGRAQTVMSAFSQNWNQKYELWPIPQAEIQRNPALAGSQNPGY
jgi:starch-binding outer membrane protein, SusD/RagB family